MHENFFFNFKVYYEDTDSGGVVYYANYLKFLERARTEALFSIGFSNKKIKDIFNSLIIVKSCNIEYKKSAHLEDELNVRSFVKSITRTSFLMNQIITKEDQIIIEARDFLRAIEAKTNIWPTFQEGMEVNQIIEAARDSSFKRAWVHVCDY